VKRRGRKLTALTLLPAAVLALLLAAVLASLPLLQTGIAGGPVTAGSREQIPEYGGEPYVVVHGDEPYFTQEEIAEAKREGNYFRYAELDAQGRAGAACACVSEETVDTSNRPERQDYTPSGWKQNRFPDVIPENSGYLMNRGHLIMRYLGGADDLRNIIAMTQCCNQSMEQHEKKVLHFVYSDGGHVLYRVTPVYRGTEKVARGVLMEAASVEDDSFRFCVFHYNEQPGIALDHMTGESRLQ
jgi:DNA-entry nuclease